MFFNDHFQHSPGIFPVAPFFALYRVIYKITRNDNALSIENWHDGEIAQKVKMIRVIHSNFSALPTKSP
jgi:hypothetical protein